MKEAAGEDVIMIMFSFIPTHGRPRTEAGTGDVPKAMTSELIETKLGGSIGVYSSKSA